MSSYRTLIVGGGISGLALADARAAAGDLTVVAEAQPEWQISSSGITLQPSAVRALDRLGLLNLVEQRGSTHTEFTSTKSYDVVVGADGINSQMRDLVTDPSAGRPEFAGGATHAPPPVLASGGGMAMDDAFVLSEKLDSGADLETACGAYTDRRWPRTRGVVEHTLDFLRALLGDIRGPEAARLEQVGRDALAGAL